MNTLRLCVFSVAVLILFGITRCKKDQTPSEIILYNKPLSVIQSSILGKWRVQYAYGGTCGTCKYDRFMYNEYYVFSPKSKIIYIYKDSVVDDTTYKWISYQGGGSDYLHHIIEHYSKGSAPYHLEPVKIINDTLVLAQPFFRSPDYILYFLTKSK